MPLPRPALPASFVSCGQRLYLGGICRAIRSGAFSDLVQRPRQRALHGLTPFERPEHWSPAPEQPQGAREGRGGPNAGPVNPRSAERVRHGRRTPDFTAMQDGIAVKRAAAEAHGGAFGRPRCRAKRAGLGRSPGGLWTRAYPGARASRAFGVQIGSRPICLWFLSFGQAKERNPRAGRLPAQKHSPRSAAP